MTDVRPLPKIMNPNSTLRLIVLCSSLSGLGVGLCRADTTAPNGNPGDWSDLLTNAPAPITAVGSGGPSGGAYTILNNIPDEYSLGYGSGPFSNYGAPGPGYSYNYSGTFYQSIDVYLDPSWATADNVGDAFWVDMTPGPAGDQLWGAENNFQIVSTGTGLDVTADGGPGTLASITTAGWYDFEMVYSHGATGSDPVVTDLNLYSVAGNSLLGTAAFTAIDDGPGTFESSNLTGTGYVWLTVWNDGFAGNQVAVADADTGAVPDGCWTAVLLGGSLLGFLLYRRRCAAPAWAG